MKSLNVKQVNTIGIGLFFSFIIGLSGCGSQKTAVTNAAQNAVLQPAGPYVPPGAITNQTTATTIFNYGASAPIVLDGLTPSLQAQTFNDYVGATRVNYTGLTLNINLVPRGTGFGGQIAIGYFDQDANMQRTGVFKNGDSAIFPNTPLIAAAANNIWFTQGGITYFHGFFQDHNGGVIIVIDNYIGQGDGVAPTQASGSIWYKNFVFDPFAVKPPHPPSHCWTVSLGPYDCRSWKSGNGVNTLLSPNPTDGYVKLGSFTGLDLSVGFNGAPIAP